MAIKLVLPNQEIQEFVTFEDYEAAYNKIIEQRRWKTINQKDLTEGKLRLFESQVRLEKLLVFNQQKNIFFNPDPEKALRDHQAFKEKCKKISQRDKEVSTAIQPAVEIITNLYLDPNQKIKDRGRFNFRIAVMEAFGEELHFMKDWDNNTFHGDMEISDVFKKLFSSNKLDLVLRKFI